jgi:hypothetical protein
MAATCGVALNNAMASGINVLGDTHGGAGQQCVELLLPTQLRPRRRRGPATSGPGSGGQAWVQQACRLSWT